MRRTLLLVAAVLTGAAPLQAARLDISPAAAGRGQVIFQSVCRSCHGLKYLKIDPQLAPDAAKAAFGEVPPDLSLMALARGRGAQGADYIRRLLTSYNSTPAKNAVFPDILMPPPFDGADPDLGRKASDVAAYLLLVADPHAGERTSLGIWVIGYLMVLTLLLFLVNRRTWRKARAGPG